MTRRAAVAGAVLALVTLAVCVLVFPSDWSVVPGADADSFVSPVTSGQWTIATVLVLTLAVASGVLGHRWMPLLGCGVPAVGYYGVQAGRAEVIGANLWVVGAFALLITMIPSLIGAGWLGWSLRRAVGHPIHDRWPGQSR